MKEVRLGKTDVMVSEVGFGGIPIIPLSHEDAVKVVDHGFDRASPSLIQPICTGIVKRRSVRP